MLGFFLITETIHQKGLLSPYLCFFQSIQLKNTLLENRTSDIVSK